MFGMGFMEIFLILIIGIIALGPEKLPSALVDAAKFFKKFKSGIDDAKSTLDSELNISEMKQQAEEFKASVGDIKSIASVDLDSLNSDRLLEDEPKKKPKPKVKTEKIKVAKKAKKEKISLDTKDA